MTMTTIAYSWLASGVIGSEKRRKPYPPIFSITAASTTEPPVGASTWASGNQVCTGTIGTFTAKAARKAKKSQACSFASSGAAARSANCQLPVFRYR